jgi:hypothetical protein
LILQEVKKEQQAVQDTEHWTLHGLVALPAAASSCDNTLLACCMPSYGLWR